MNKFRELDLLIVILTLFYLVIVIRYFASSNKIPTNNIEYVDSLDNNNLKYPLIIKDGEVYQLTKKINWKVID